MKLINSPFLILMALLSTAISSAPASVFVTGKELDTKTNLNPRRAGMDDFHFEDGEKIEGKCKSGIKPLQQ